MGLIEDFSRRTEFARRVGTIILAVAKALTPIPELTEPVTMVQEPTPAFSPYVPPENEITRLSRLFYKSVIEDTRFTVRANTFQGMYNRGDASSSTDGPPRRRWTTKDGKELIFTL